MSGLTADEIAAVLTLEPLADGGGRGRETYRDETAVTAFRLLAAGERLAWSQLIDAVEVWQFYDGAPLTLSLAAVEGGETRDETLAREAGGARRTQVGVPSGWWRAAETTGEWSLVGVTAAIAFDLPPNLAP